MVRDDAGACIAEQVESFPLHTVRGSSQTQPAGHYHATMPPSLHYHHPQPELPIYQPRLNHHQIYQPNIQSWSHQVSPSTTITTTTTWHSTPTCTIWLSALGQYRTVLYRKISVPCFLCRKWLRLTHWKLKYYSIMCCRLDSPIVPNPELMDFSESS